MSITTKYTPQNDMQGSSLVITFKNFKYNVSFLNSIRRILMEYIPTYGFDRELIKFTKNTGYQNNDQLSLRLSQIPVLGISSNLLFINDNRWKKVNYDKAEDEFPEEKQYDVRIHVSNPSDKFKDVTTNDFNIFINGVQVKNPYNQLHPMLITRLREGEELNCNMIAKIRLGILNNTWTPVYNTFCVKQEGTENTYNFVIHSYGQKSEKDLFNQAIDIILYRLNNIIKPNIFNKIENYEEKEIDINIEDKSLANILVASLKDDNDVLFVGTEIISFLDPNVILHLKISDKSDLKKILSKHIENINKIYNEIKTEFNKNI